MIKRRSSLLLKIQPHISQKQEEEKSTTPLLTKKEKVDFNKQKPTKRHWISQHPQSTQAKNKDLKSRPKQWFIPRSVIGKKMKMVVKSLRGYMWGIGINRARLSYRMGLLSNTARLVDLLPGASSVESNANGACPLAPVLDE